MEYKVKIDGGMVIVHNELGSGGFLLGLQEADKLQTDLKEAVDKLKCKDEEDLEILSKLLLSRLQDQARNTTKEKYPSLFPLCCAPHVNDDSSVRFWINTGRFTQMDGWQTQEDIEKFLESGEKLILVDELR